MHTRNYNHPHLSFHSMVVFQSFIRFPFLNFCILLTLMNSPATNSLYTRSLLGHSLTYSEVVNAEKKKKKKHHGPSLEPDQLTAPHILSAQLVYQLKDLIQNENLMSYNLM
jgi:hypothetical protein